MSCRKTRVSRKKYCLGDFRHYISIIDSTVNPVQESYDIDNTDIVLNTKAAVRTKGGIVFFSGVATEAEVTHEFIIRFPSIEVEKSNRILFKGDLYRIETIVNENEDDKFLKIGAVKRGKATIKANNS